MTHLAMAFAIAHPGVTSAIIGPRTMEPARRPARRHRRHAHRRHPRPDRRDRPARHRRRHARPGLRPAGHPASRPPPPTRRAPRRRLSAPALSERLPVSACDCWDDGVDASTVAIPGWRTRAAEGCNAAICRCAKRRSRVGAAPPAHRGQPSGRRDPRGCSAAGARALLSRTLPLRRRMRQEPARRG